MSRLLQTDAFKITSYVLAVVFLGAILAPLLFWGGKHVVTNGWLADGWLDSIHDSMERAKFSRYFNRAILLAAVLLIYPAIKWVQGPRQPKSQGTSRFSWLLLQPDPSRWLHLSVGFLFAAGTLLSLGMIYIQVGYYRFWEEHDPYLSIFFSAAGSAFAVAFLEEFVFRGALFALVLRTVTPLKALIFISIFFSLVHFLKPPEGLEMPPVTATTGFWMIGQIFIQFTDWKFLAAEFGLLFFVGLILGYTRLKTHSLWLGIGLHAGWVFGIKAYSSLTRKEAPLAEMLPWAGQNLKIGFWSMVIVIFTGIVIWFWLESRIKRSAFESIEQK